MHLKLQWKQMRQGGKERQYLIISISKGTGIVRNSAEKHI